MASKVLILAGDTDGNLGDLAIVTATCDALRAIDADVEISLVTGRPQRDVAALGIRPLRRGPLGLPGLLAAARRADLVICGGGGLFQDDDSLLKMPYWALRLSLIRCFTRRLAGLAIGAGPLGHGTSRFFARVALRMLDPVSVRDPAALITVEPLSRRAVRLVPDPAFMLRPARKETARQFLGAAGVPLDATPLVGVAPRRWFHKGPDLIPWKVARPLGLRRGRGEGRMNVFVERLAATLDRVVGETHAHIVFMPSYNVPHEDDAAVCRAIAARMQTGTRTVLEIGDPRLYRAVCGTLSAIVCGRMHPAILATAEGTPALGLAYNQKFAGMFSMLGRPENCLSMTDFVTRDADDSLAARIASAIAAPEAFRVSVAPFERSTRHFIAGLLAGTGGEAAPAASQPPPP